jgi:beta-galactosidase
MIKFFKTALYLILLIIPIAHKAQISTKQIPSSAIIALDSTIQKSGSVRKLMPLINDWKVSPESNPSKSITSKVPCVFNGTETLIFEKRFDLSVNELENSIIKIGFWGINNSVEISLNNYNIFKKNGTEIPFEIELPKDILRTDVSNRITLKVHYSLDSENTIPVNQRFLFPKNAAGIIRDVFLIFIPKINISSYNLSYTVDLKNSVANVSIPISIKEINQLQNSTIFKESVSLKISFIPQNFIGSQFNFEFPIQPSSSELFSSTYKFSLQNPALWSPEIPNVYSVAISLSANKQIIDQVTTETSFLKLDKSKGETTLNGKTFSFKGTTYFLSESELQKVSAVEKIRNDISIAKKIGFNSIRFAKSYPHPKVLQYLQQAGLFAFIELPINSIPESLLEDNNFVLRVEKRFEELINSYSSFSSNIIWGIGSSFLSNSEITENFISSLLKKTNYDLFTYSSFIGLQKNTIENLDLYGIEIYSNNPESIENLLTGFEEEPEVKNYFFSEISYPNYLGSSGGYLVKNSSEAQAKYFSNVIDIAKKKNLSGFFINSLFDYSGDFTSLYGGYSKDDSYKLGILSEQQSYGIIVKKVLESKLNNTTRVTIPIGRGRDENKLMFILLALVLSIVMAILINIKKKFREDCTRALFRPYNFFADVRDHRIISGLHTLVLLLVEAGSISLFLTILLYYLRSNLLLEKLLLAFGKPFFISKASFLAWNPELSFLYIFFLVILIVILISLLIKAVSFLIKTRVGIGSIFYMVVWSLLPFTILLPVELIFYKILMTGSYSLIVLIFQLLFYLWILQRILKGIYVLFDISKVTVYLYGTSALIIAIGGILFYFQLTNSTVYYLINAVKQYNLISF